MGNIRLPNHFPRLDWKQSPDFFSYDTEIFDSYRPSFCRNVLGEVEFQKRIDLCFEVVHGDDRAAVDGLLQDHVGTDGREERGQVVQALDGLHAELEVAFAELQWLDLAELEKEKDLLARWGLIVASLRGILSWP